MIRIPLRWVMTGRARAHDLALYDVFMLAYTLPLYLLSLLRTLVSSPLSCLSRIIMSLAVYAV